MTTLSGTFYLDRTSIIEVVDNPNTTRRRVLSGSAGNSGGGSTKTDDITQSGEFRAYGNGNVRLILGSNVTRTQTLALRAIKPSQLAVLEALVGRTVCYRDHYGRKIFGAFLSISVQALAHSGKAADDTLLYDVGMVVQSVTYSEEV